MKFPIVIFKNESGYVISIPESEMKLENAKPLERESLPSGLKVRGEIPERWKRPCKLYSGFIYGIHPPIVGEADSIEELREMLKQGVSEDTIEIEAAKDWPGSEIQTIEI